MTASETKFTFLLFISLFFLPNAQAQLKVTNTLMASASYSTERPNISIANSFGETFIFSNSTGAIYYNQGFHNSEIKSLVSINDEASSIHQVSIYPNPVQNEIFIKSEVRFQSLKIMAFDGQLIKSDTISEGQSINVSELDSGLYLIICTTADNIKYSGKFLKI